MQTVNELKPAIGQTVGVKFESILVHCVVIDAKSAYGRARFLVQPVNTWKANTQWVELARMQSLDTWPDENFKATKHNPADITLKASLAGMPIPGYDPANPKGGR